MSRMKALFVLVLIFGTALAAQVQSPPALAPKALAGDYAGSITAAGATLRLGLKLELEGDAKLKGVLDSIDQLAKIPIDAVTLTDRTIKLQLKSIGGSFEGKVADDAKTIEGTWSQGGQNLPLTFKRVDAPPVLRRPQEPKKPYPYDEQEVVVENADAKVKLGGTLTLPKDSSKRGKKSLPAVLLITGSGQQDRDEAIMGHRPFLVLSDHLTRNAGIAVLRLDDRGIGKSTGDFSKATQPDFVADANAAVAFLRKHPDIDPARVGLLGHSEGALTAPLVAAADPKIAFVVLLAGPGVPMDQLLVRQAQDVVRIAGGDEEMVKKIGEIQRKLFDAIKQETDDARLEAQLRAIIREAPGADQPAAQPQIDAQLQMVRSPWFRQLAHYDPAPALRKVKCPVLAINGEKDIQVAAKENLDAIRAALQGNPDVKISELPGHNHLLQQCQTGGVGEYGTIEQTMSPDALTLIGDWISRNTSTP